MGGACRVEGGGIEDEVCGAAGEDEVVEGLPGGAVAFEFVGEVLATRTRGDAAKGFVQREIEADDKQVELGGERVEERGIRDAGGFEDRRWAGFANECRDRLLVFWEGVGLVGNEVFDCAPAAEQDGIPFAPAVAERAEFGANGRLAAPGGSEEHDASRHRAGVCANRVPQIDKRQATIDNRRVPELPEVETIRRDLEPLVVGRRITGVDVDPGTIHLLAGASIEQLRANLVGRTFTAMGRRGKYILLSLDDGRVFVVHLRMTGRLVWREHSAPGEQYQRAVLELDNGYDLRWADLRKFGTWRIHESVAEVIDKLGPEPIDAELTEKQFRAVLAKRTAPVKAVLLDQRRFAGLGNIYVDEALYEARIRPDTPAGELSPQAVKRLFHSSRAVLERGIENRGASFKDYVDGQGNQGQQHMHVQVFRRTGKPCYACGSMIQRTVVGGRSTHFCPKCQPKARKRSVARAG